MRDCLYLKQKPASKSLPVVVVALLESMSGSGFQASQVAVIANLDSRDKSALSNAHLIPRAAIVDPQLTLSVPPIVTATTGFDVLCHAFESILNPRSNVATELFAWEALRRVISDLSTAGQEGANLSTRSSMAWADTLAGMSICRAGGALPHGIAMAVGGMVPNTPHGMALAPVFRACLEFTWGSAVPAVARLARVFLPTPDGVGTSEAACC